MGNLHAQIIDYLLTQSWQIGVLAVAIAAVSLAVKNKSAHVRYLLWLIVLAKCLVPPLYTITLAVLPQQEVAEPAVAAPVEIPAVAVMVEAVPTEPVTLPSRAVLAPPVEPSIAERLAEVTFRQWLAFVWIIGVGVFVLAAVIKALRVNQWLRRERMALPAKLQSEIEKLFAELGVKTVPKVWLVEGIGQPFVWGLLRGSIYLPGNFVGVTGDESRRGVLGHELSHILRFDAAVNLLQIIAQGIFWFHPFVWWANKKIRAEREKCCDEMAIARLGAKAKDYSSAIVNTLIAEHEATLPIPSLAVAGPVKNIEDRIKTIMNPGKKFYKRPSLIAAITVLLLASLAVPTTLALTRRKVDKADVGVEGEYDNSLYQKQGSIRYALEFIGMPEELIDTTFVSKHGQLAGPQQLGFANKLFSVSKSKDVDAFIFLLSDGTKEQLNDGNNRRMLHHRIKGIKEGTFFHGQYDFKFFATFREFTDEDWNTLKKHVSFPETPTHIIVYWHFDKPAYSLCGSSYYLIEDNGSYKFVAQTLLSGPVIPAKKEQPTGPKEYGIVSFKQTDEAYTKPGIWKYHWNIELSPEVSENNVFQILRTTKVVSGQAELHPEIAAQKIIDESMIEKYKYDILKCRFYVGNSEPRYNCRKYGRQLSGWAYGFSIASWSRSTSMLFPGKDVTNVKPNKQGNFVGSDLELLSFETSEENIRYEHKVILRKDDSPEAKSAALLRLEQMTRRQISNKKLQYLDRVLTAYANDHNSKYPDRLEQIKPYDTDEWLDWLLENIEYLGKGKTLTETSNTVLAYDKTLLGKAGSTNVLFNDGPVQYCNPDWLKKLGITGNQKPTVGVEVEVEKETTEETVRNLLYETYDIGTAGLSPLSGMLIVERLLEIMQKEPRGQKLFAIAVRGTDAQKEALLKSVKRMCNVYLNELPEFQSDPDVPWQASVIHSPGVMAYPPLLLQLEDDPAQTLDIVTRMYLRMQQARREYFQAKGTHRDIGSCDEGTIMAYVCHVCMSRLASDQRFKEQATAEQLKALEEYEDYRAKTARWNPADEQMRIMKFAARVCQKQADLDANWGVAVEGLQCRLRPDGTKWQAGETPTLKADIRNLGTHQLYVVQHQGLCELWRDGRWYGWAGEIRAKSSPLGPGREYNDIPILLDEHWVSKSNGNPLRLRRRHIVRVAFTAEPSEPKQGEVIRVNSNPVEIEILPKEVESDSSIRGAEREAAARRTRAMGRRRRISFIGLDLTDAPRTTNQADLPDLFEERPVGSGSYALRDEVVAARHPEFWEEGVVYYVAEKKQFYIIEEPGHPGSGSKTFYGPFAGEPWKRFGMAEPRPVKKQYRFAIYLVVDPIDVGHPEDVTLEQLRLGSVPVLTEEDIVEYDWNEHFLKLTPEAWKRVPSPRSVWGLPFVVVADGQRCYLGAFWGFGSSYMPKVPFIGGFRPGWRENKIQISPPEPIAGMKDPRNDPQVRKVLEELGIAGEPAWGEPVDGVRCRLRATKRVWKVGERPTFSLDVRNYGDSPIRVDFSSSLPRYEIEYDGRWYGYTGRRIIRGSLYVMDLVPGEEISDAVGVDFPGVWVTPVPPNDGKPDLFISRIREEPQKLLDFSPGTHEVRVRLYPGRHTQDRGTGVVSNPVQIEILPWGGTASKGEAVREKPSVWLTVLPKNPIRSLNEYEHWIRTDPRPTAPLYKPVPIPACDFEIRRASDQQRVARIPLGESFGGTGELTQSARRRFGWLGNGEYLVALCIGYWRCSNVSRLTLDSDFDGSVEPTLSLVSLEAAPGGKLPFLGIRAVGPTPQDPKLTNETIAFPKLVVDGVERNLKTLKWAGPVAPLESGKIYTRILDLDGYEPAIEPGKEHTVKAIVGKYESVSVVIPADNLLGQQWDIATKKLPPVPPPRIVLEGKVTGLEGKVAEGYQVSLSNLSGSVFKESTKQDGTYQFINVPPGKYSLVCHLKGKGMPDLEIENVQIHEGETLTVDMSLHRKYILSGTVSYEDGRPAANIGVWLSCEDQQNNAEFNDYTAADANGWYELGGPFGTVSYIGIKGKRIEGSMPRLEPGRTELRFILRKNEAGRYVAHPTGLPLPK